MTDETQPQATGHGWTGFFVLRGHWDVSLLYRGLLEQPGPLHVVHGDAQSGTTNFREYAASDSRSDVLASVVQRMPVKPFTFFLCGDPPDKIHVPARSSTVALWHQGHATPGFDRMMDNLVQLNRDAPPPPGSNYATLFRERVLDDQRGKYAICLGYFSRHPRIVLAARNMELYTWIVYHNGVYLFLWSTDQHYMERLKQSLHINQQNELFYTPVPFELNANLVIHPVYWITKFDKAMSTIKDNNRLVITAYMRNYITRTAVARPLHEDQNENRHQTDQ